MQGPSATWRVVCTGHSLGGALATLAAYELLRREVPGRWAGVRGQPGQSTVQWRVTRVGRGGVRVLVGGAGRGLQVGEEVRQSGTWHVSQVQGRR